MRDVYERTIIAFFEVYNGVADANKSLLRRHLIPKWPKILDRA